MKYSRIFIFCLTVFCNTATAQFRNIKIAELKYPEDLKDLIITSNAIFLTEKPFSYSLSYTYSSSQTGIEWNKTEDQKRIDSLLKNDRNCRGPNNQIYTAFADGNELKFSMASGKTYTIAPFKNGHSYLVNGKLPANGLPTIACDLSNGEHRGRIYVCWSDEKYGETNKDVFLAYSDDEGTNWTEPIIVTYRPNHKEQFMPCMAVDQNTGFVYVLYYDQQNSASGNFTDVYLARSKNGGLLFDFYKINSAPIQIKGHMSLGKRCGLTIDDSVVHPVWIQPETKKKTLVFTAFIDEGALTNYNKNANDNLTIEKTFVFSDQVKLDFELKQQARMTFVLTNPLDHTFEKLVAKNKKMKKGHNSLLIDTKKLGIPKGNYTLTLYYGGKNIYVWIIEE